MPINQQKRGFQISRHLPAYLRSGILLHAITMMELLSLFVFTSNFFYFGPESIVNSIFNMMILLFLASLPILSQLDARSRFQSYKRVKDNLFIYGFDTRIISPFSKSRCQRDAAIAAADELGYKSLCCSYYHAQGYRWYHILPDFVFSNPRFLVSRRFWLSTFFSKTYHSRISF
jgi:hypothetical protein